MSFDYNATGAERRLWWDLEQFGELRAALLQAQQERSSTWLGPPDQLRVSYSSIPSWGHLEPPT